MNTNTAEQFFVITEGCLVSLNNGRPQYAYDDARGALLALCTWNDPQGCYTNEARELEDVPVASDSDLLAIVNEWCAQDEPTTQNLFDKWLAANWEVQT
jgi:hypothetical protein